MHSQFEARLEIATFNPLNEVTHYTVRPEPARVIRNPAENSPDLLIRNLSAPVCRGELTRFIDPGVQLRLVDSAVIVQTRWLMP